MIRRKDYGKSTDNWYSSLDETLIPIAHKLRTLIYNIVPNTMESLKWGMPNFQNMGCSSFCALRSGKGYIALQFGSIGMILNDPENLLEGSGKSGMRHIKIYSKDEINTQLISSWIKVAAKKYSYY